MINYTKYMRKSILSLVSLAFLFMSTACSGAIDAKSSSAQAVDVDVKTVQEVLLPGRAILIDADVAQGNNKVKDADDVKIEIWKKDSDNHKMITATHWLDGTYRTKTLFSESGTYYMRAHVKDQRGDVTTTEQELFVKDVLPSESQIKS
ncbi:FixH family protein [Paenibacillus sp. UNC451MF]|uniref:FixH family protein n=1 Tax=Paenibacillus sp. UNC451MF TaxID=1449063 RepID=UPI00068ECEB7|nr:FixH family protein [Paenibacillus sp. UNC451MF]